MLIAKSLPRGLVAATGYPKLRAVGTFCCGPLNVMTNCTDRPTGGPYGPEHTNPLHGDWCD